MEFRSDLNIRFDRLEQRIAEMGGERRYPAEERLKLGEAGYNAEAQEVESQEARHARLYRALGKPLPQKIRSDKPYPLTEAKVKAYLEAKTFDAILVMEVVEHVPDVQELLSECIQRLKPGGHLFVATINRTLASFVTAIVGAEYVFRMLPRGTHQWSKFVKPEEIISPLTRSDMTLIKTSGISVNPFGPRFRLTRYMGVNYMLAFKKGH